MIKEAVVLAGGFGTRLKAVVADVPKPMADVNGKPFLVYLLDYLSVQGIEKVILAVGYKHEIIQGYFGGKYKNIQIEYVIEEEPLGTGGAVKLAASKIESSTFFVFNGDTYFDVPLKEMSLNKDKRIMLAAKKMHDFDRYGTLEIEDDGTVSKFNEKKPCSEGYINGGIYLLEKSLLNQIEDRKFSFETAILEVEAKNGSLSALKNQRYFMDIGIPEDYYQFSNDMEQLKVINSFKIDSSWTLFLDRDGVINRRLVGDYVKNLAELEILPGVKEALKTFKKMFGRIVVVTNQQGIGKGVMTVSDLGIIHSEINKELDGAIDQFYFAPQLTSENHPDRKPGSGMGIRAKQEYPQIDFNKSLMIGDSESDIGFGLNLSMKTIMLAEESIKTEAHWVAKDLPQVADFLVKRI